MASEMLGFVINPVAGLGGPAGLKGSDSAAVQQAALARGAVPRAGERAAAALAPLAEVRAPILTAGGPMGADAVVAAGLRATVVYTPDGPTTGYNTTAAVAAMVAAGARLIMFVGGDGTARDVADAGMGVPILGVPAGVKMYSGCFAVSPAAAGRVALRVVLGQPVETRSAEVLDVDELSLAAAPVSPVLYGLVDVPQWRGSTQNRKVATLASASEQVAAAASGAVRAMLPGVCYLLGPGGTTLEVGRQLGVDATPLGVDVVLDGALIGRDASENEILALIEGRPARAVVTIIGGQGFVLGRGNQQLSPAVLRRLGPEPLLIVADEAKLAQLAGRPLLVDTGDADLDAELCGYAKVVTGPNTWAVFKLVAASIEGAS